MPCCQRRGPIMGFTIVQITIRWVCHTASIRPSTRAVVFVSRFQRRLHQRTHAWMRFYLLRGLTTAFTTALIIKRWEWLIANTRPSTQAAVFVTRHFRPPWLRRRLRQRKGRAWTFHYQMLGLKMEFTNALNTNHWGCFIVSMRSSKKIVVSAMQRHRQR